MSESASQKPVAPETVRYADAILLDGLMARQASGWLNKKYAEKTITACQNGKFFPLRMELSSRYDLPKDCLAFSSELPFEMSAAELLEGNIIFFIAGEGRIRINMLALLRFALGGLEEQERTILAEMMDFSAFLPKNRPKTL